MWTSQLFKPFPAVRYILVFGLPSLTLVGLITLFRRRWRGSLFRLVDMNPKLSSEMPKSDLPLANGESTRTLAHEKGKELGLPKVSTGTNVHVDVTEHSRIGEKLSQAQGAESSNEGGAQSRDARSCATEETNSAGGKLSQGSSHRQSSMSERELHEESGSNETSSQCANNTLCSSSGTKECSRGEDALASPTKELPEGNKKDRIRIQLQLPREVIGRFIGKQGRNIKALMQESDGAYVFLNQKSVPKDAMVVPCTIQGTSKQVNEALIIIERKFPEISISDALVNTSSSPGGILAAQQQMMSIFPTPPCSTVPAATIEAVESWDCELQPATVPIKYFSATVSYIESVSHVWMVPREVSKDMDELHRSMSYSYCYGGSLRHTLPQPSANSQTDLIGRFCAVRVSEIHWLRGRIAKFGEDMLTYEVQLVDYGSYVIVPPASINPLRKEYCKLPVLAFKALLAHVQPVKAGTETTTEGLLAMQQMMENVTLEVHITGKVPFSSPTARKSSKDLSVWFSSLPSTDDGSTPPRAELDTDDGKCSGRDATVGDEEPDDEDLDVRALSLKKRMSHRHSNSEMSVLSEHSVGSINGDSGVSGIFAKSFDLQTPVSSRGEPSTLQSLDSTESSGTGKHQLSPVSDICDDVENPTASGGDHQTNALEVPEISQEILEGEDSSSLCENGSRRKSVADVEVEKRSEASGHLEGSESGPPAAAVVTDNSKPGSAVEKSALMVEEVEMNYLSSLSELAPYIPVVEIYTQVGAQSPTFVNRELVELGYAIWIEEKYAP